MESEDCSPSDYLNTLFDFDESLLTSGFYDETDNFKDVNIDDSALPEDLFPDIFNMEDTDLLQYTGGSLSDGSTSPRSPLHSDSGISEENGSPFSPLSQSSVPSPPQMTHEPCSPDQVINMDACYAYDLLSTGDPMFAEGEESSSVVSLGNGRTEMTEAEIVSATHNYCASAKIKEILPLTQKDVLPVIDSNPSPIHEKYPALVLNEEERRLLKEMKISLPSHLPLTKAEERSLKTVRRKIRNKASAQESRRKKKIYIDGLEGRVEMCTKHNATLQRKVTKLEKENQSLIGQLRKLQAMVSGGNKPAQAGTCVMVLLLSFTLLIAPNLSPFDSQKPSVDSYKPAGVKSRTLMSTPASSVYWFEQNQDAPVEDFTPAKARKVDSFIANEADVVPPQTVEVILDAATLAGLQSKGIDGMVPEVIAIETDVQSIFNQSEEDARVVHEGGRFGRKLILNDEM